MPPKNAGCRRLLNYRNGRTRVTCRTHPSFATGWLTNMEAIAQWNNHAKEAK